MDAEVSLRKKIQETCSKIKRISSLLDSYMKMISNKNTKKSEFISVYLDNQNKYISEIEDITASHETLIKEFKYYENLVSSLREEMKVLSSMYSLMLRKMRSVYSYVEAYTRNTTANIDIMKRKISNNIKRENPYNKDGKLLSDHEVLKSMPSICIAEGF